MWPLKKKDPTRSEAGGNWESTHFPDPEVTELLSEWLRDNLDYALVLLDEHGVVREWLGASEFVLGYTAAEAVGQPIAFLFTDEDRQQHLHRQELEVARVQGRAEDDRWHLRRDGSRIWMSGAVTAMRRPDGSVRAYVKVMRDRTDWRAQLERSEASVAQLTDARERTHQYLRTLGHEIRNTLGPMQNALYIVRRTTQDTRASSAVTVAEKQLDVLKRLADDLVDVVRLESGKMQIQKERCDLRELLATTAQSFQSAAAAADVKLETVLPVSPLWVEVDLPRMQQVVSNLLTNAIKYNRPGGRVWLKATREVDEVVFRVGDTGMGIPPHLLPELFQLFTRSEVAEAVAPTGLGVGLALVRQLVELHGGTVQARSPGVDKGAEFAVRLPAAEGQAQGEG
jgi:PAS domain S-box-containing protein